MRYFLAIFLLVFSFSTCLAQSPPVVTTQNLTLEANQNYQASTLFSVSSTNQITQYEVWQSLTNTGGFFSLNGVAQAPHTYLIVPASQLSQLQFVTGTGNENLQIRAYDGTNWSSCDTCAWSPFTITVQSLPSVPLVYLQPQGLSMILALLPNTCSTTDVYPTDYTIQQWTNNLGVPIYIHAVKQNYGEDFNVAGSNAPVGQYSSGVMLLPAGVYANRIPVASYGPQVYTKGYMPSNHDEHYDAPYMVVQPNDALYFVATCFTSVIGGTFRWQSTIKVEFTK